MNFDKGLGLITIILGLIFILFPIFSSELISVIVGASLLFFGVAVTVMGWGIRKENNIIGTITLVIGIIAIIFGLLFLFAINALSFLVAYQFYIVGFIMIFTGITGIISKNKISIFSSILILIMGAVAIALAVLALSEPLYIAIIIGICLIIEGASMLLVD